MNKSIYRLAITACIALTATSSAASSIDDREFTRWHVQTSPGLDALVFVGALCGNKLQHDY